MIDRALQSGLVRMINSGVDYSSNSKSIDLVGKYDFFSATLGLSPNILQDIKEPELKMLLAQIESLAGQAVGIGEAGLDYYHCKDAPGRERQAAVFKKVIALA